MFAFCLVVCAVVLVMPWHSPRSIPSGSIDAVWGPIGEKVSSNGAVSPNIEDASRWVQYGFAPDPEADNFLQQKTKLFDFIPPLDTGGGGDYSVILFANGKIDHCSSDSSSEYSSKLSAKVGIDASYGAFTGAVSVATQQEQSSNDRQMRYDTFDRAYIAKVMSAVGPSSLPGKLTDDARQDLLILSPKEIYDNYGAFYASGLTLGGTIVTSVVREMRGSDTLSAFQSSVEASYEFMAMKAASSAEGAYSTRSSDKFARQTVRASVWGGSVSQFLGLDDYSDYAALKKRWSDSVPDNLAAIEFQLHPIWEIIEKMNSTQANLVKDHTLSAWRKVCADCNADFAQWNIVDITMVTGDLNSNCTSLTGDAQYSPIERSYGSSSYNGDLNWAAGGEWVGLCVTKAETARPITDVSVTNQAAADGGCPGMPHGEGWGRITQGEGSNGDANQGLDGGYIYMCVQHGGTPLLDVGLDSIPTCENLQSKHGGTWRKAQQWGESNGDLCQNNDCSGGPPGGCIYLCKRTA